MSRAVSAVLKVPSALPYFLAQASATCWVRANAVVLLGSGERARLRGGELCP